MLLGLCLYFSYHLIAGERSISGLHALEYQISAETELLDELRKERAVVEDKVVRLRPGTMDEDYLEERARIVLGFVYPGERIVLE